VLGLVAVASVAFLVPFLSSKDGSTDPNCVSATSFSISSTVSVDQENAGTSAEILDRYFTAINCRDYKLSWRLGGKNLYSSYQRFVDKFSMTTKNRLTIVSQSGNRIKARVESAQKDGSVNVYEGYYRLNLGKIVRARVKLKGINYP
jgi:hypothetical protein